MRYPVFFALAAITLGTAGCEPAPVTRPFLRTGLDIDSSRLRPGIALAYVEGSFGSAAEVADADPVRSGIAARVELPGIEREESFGLLFRGYLRVPYDDLYTFEIRSDDGSQLYISEQLVIDHGGLRTPLPAVGAIGLRKGHHRLRVLYFQGDGDRNLALRVRRAGEPLGAVPDQWFYVEDPLAPDRDLPMTDAP